MKFNNNKRYYDFASFIKEHFSERVQKISLDTGFTCPNRDGSKGIVTIILLIQIIVSQTKASHNN